MKSDAMIKATYEEKVEILRKHYSQPNLITAQIIDIARDHISGFKLSWSRPPGGRKVANTINGLIFYEHVQLYKKEHGCFETDAVRAVHKQHGHMLIEATGETLQRRYRQIKNLVKTGKIDFITDAVSSTGAQLTFKTGGKCNHTDILEYWSMKAKRENFPLEQIFDGFRAGLNSKK